jgi:hypothetical protein
VSTLPAIGGALAASARFLVPAWRGAFAALLLVILGLTLAIGARLGALGAGAADVWGFATTLLLLVARGALWRLAMGVGRPGPGGLQLGVVEGRLLIVAALRLLFLSVLGLLMFVLVLAVAFAATWAPAVAVRGRVLVTIVTLAGAAGIAWAALRISLAEAATVASAKVKLLESWPLTRGRVLAILISSAVLAAPLLLLRAAAYTPLGAWAISAVGGLWIGGVWVPMSVGLMAYFYSIRVPPAQP